MFRLLIAAVFLSLTVSVSAQTRADWDTHLGEIMEPFNNPESPGALVARFEGGTVVSTWAYGMADLTQGVPITAQTRFNIGSVAKQFTGVAFALLAERGALSLDDDVRTYLPETPDFGTTVTLRNLLNHTSGFREAYGVLELDGRITDDDVLTRQDALDVVVRQEALQFAPGSRYLYNSTAFVLLTTIAERVTGEPFPDWMQTNVFAPLGMTHTMIEREIGSIIPGSATSYVRGESGDYVTEFDNRAYYGATDVYTTAEDLAAWLRMFRDNSLGEGSVVPQMLTRGILTSGDTLPYALGMGVDSYRGHLRISHTGSTGGYRALLTYFPDVDRGFAVLANAEDVDLRALASALTDLTIGDAEPTPTTGAPSNSEPDDVEAWEPTPEELSAFRGRYDSAETTTNVELTLEDGSLVIVHPRLGQIPLEPAAPDAFAGPNQIGLIFERGPDGSVAGFRLSTGRLLGLRYRKTD